MGALLSVMDMNKYVAASQFCCTYDDL